MNRAVLRRRKPIETRALGELRRMVKDNAHASPMDHTSIERNLADGTTGQSLETSPEGVVYQSIPNTQNDLGDISGDDAGNWSAPVGNFGMLFAGGLDVGASLTDMPRGLFARCAPRTSAAGCNPSTGSSHNQAVMRFEFTVRPGFNYVVQASGLKAKSLGIGTIARFRMTATTDGTYANEGSPVVASDITAAPDPDDPDLQLPGLSLRWEFPNLVERQVSVMISYSAYGGTDSVLINPSSTSPFLLGVREERHTGTTGRNDFVGTVSASTTPPPQTSAPREVLQTWKANAVRSWNSDGSLYKSDRMYQGVSPYYGTGGLKSSHAVFTANGDKGQTISQAMDQATEILDLTVGIHFDHWHANSGGIARVSRHASTAVGSMPALSLLKETGADRNAWLRLKITDPVDVQAFLSKNFLGLGLNAVSSSSSYYGFASGPGSNAPWIACRYITN